MTANASVRFYDPFTVDAFDDYNGRIVLVVPPIDPGDWTSGDGFANEIDVVVADPDDSTYVWDIYVYTLTDGSIPDSTVISGFTFDSDAPTIWDGYGATRVLKTTYDAYGVLYPYSEIYDGSWAGPTEAHVRTDLDPLSDPDWNHYPQHAAASIDAPASGGSIDSGVTFSVGVTVSSAAAFTELQYRFPGGPSGSASFVATSSRSFTVPIPFPTNTTDIEARVRGAGTSWSDWATIPYTISGTIDTPVACFEDESLLDSPMVLWMFREAAGATSTADLSGNGNTGYYINHFDYLPPGAGDSPEAAFDPSGVCDGGCSDVNHAVKFFYPADDTDFTGHVRTSNVVGAGNYPLSDATDFTIEIIAAIFAVDGEPGAGIYAGAQSLDPDSENEAILWPVWMLPDGHGGTTTFGTSIPGNPQGCYTHLVWTYSSTPDAAGNYSHYYVNGLMVDASDNDLVPTQLYDATEGPTQVVGEIAFGGGPGYEAASVVAFYRSKLPYHRVVAHYRHQCRCGGVLVRPPVRIGQRTDELRGGGVRVGQRGARSVQRTARILGPGSVV